MVQTTTIIAAIVSLLVCFGLPIVSLIVLNRRQYRITRSFLVGALTFFLTQIVIRIPIITLWLPNLDWYIRLSLDPWRQGLFLGLTAGLAEELGRFLLARLLLKRNRRFIDGIAFGIGHGGIEAMLLTGMTQINLLILMLAINSGGFEKLLATSSAAASATAIRQQILALQPFDLLLGGIERIIAIALHIGLTMIIWTGLRTGRPWPYLLAAILIHAVVDASVVILPSLLPISQIGMELTFAAWSGLLLLYTIRARRFYRTTVEQPPATHPAGETATHTK